MVYQKTINVVKNKKHFKKLKGGENEDINIDKELIKFRESEYEDILKNPNRLLNIDIDTTNKSVNDDEQLKMLYSNNLTIKKLAQLIYKYYDDDYKFKTIFIPALSNINNFYNNGRQASVLKIIQYSNIKTCRATLITNGTLYLLKKYDTLFSNMLTFLYFLVKYCKENYKNDENTIWVPPTKLNIDMVENMYKYIYFNYEEENKEINLRWWYIDTLINNNIASHVVTGHGHGQKPHFFISSAKDNKPLLYKKTVEIIANKYLKNVKGCNNKCYAQPIYIHMSVNSENSGKSYNDIENDVVLSPCINKKHIIKITDFDNKDLNIDEILSKFNEKPKILSKIKSVLSNFKPFRNKVGGVKEVYKLNGEKVELIHNNKKIKRSIYVKEGKKAKYCKIEKKYVLLSKLKKYKTNI